MKFIPDIEGETPDKIRQYQEFKVKEILTYVGSHSPYYQKIFKSLGMQLGDITALQDIRSLPTTSKNDFHRHNWEFLCVPRSHIVEYTSTSGTTGSPVTIALTESDLQRLAYNECISFSCADGTPNDLFQLMLTLDRQFMAGMAYYEGIRKLGAGLIRVGPGLPSMQWDIIQRLRPTALVAVPSFILKLIEYAQANNIDLNTSSVRKAICIGEGMRTQQFALNTLGKRISDGWDIKLYGTYASTEMQTAFTECGQSRGGHHHPELIYVEMLDDDGNDVPFGLPGEITVTTLGVEAMPLIRYRTGDIAVAYQDSCGCGRTTLRLGPVLGRKQQMIKLKGTTMYPPGIFDLLSEVAEVRDYVVEVSTGSLGTDELKISVWVKDSPIEDIIDRLRHLFQAKLRVAPDIAIVSQQEIEKLQLVGQSRKPTKFIDRRG
jgi:phenylacetate-CoA ligase